MSTGKRKKIDRRAVLKSPHGDDDPFIETQSPLRQGRTRQELYRMVDAPSPDTLWLVSFDGYC